MSNFTQTSSHTENYRSSKNTGPMNTIIISETSQSRQTIPLLSPVVKQTTKGQLGRSLGMITITQYHSTLIAHQGNIETEEERERVEVDEYDEDSDFYSPQDRDIYYDEDTGYTPQLEQGEYDSLPPVPTYTESQMAYHPHGIKRLPHFHPQKFSRRLRTLMDQRRKPRPLYLEIEPQQAKLLANSPGIPSTQERPESILRTLLRIVHTRQDYRQVHQDDTEAGYRRAVEAGFWRDIDRRVIIIGLLGLLLLGLSIGAWTMAVLNMKI